MPDIQRVVIAGLRGGSGKTTLSLALVSALARRGLRVAPFKKGPDYIDAGWLAAAAAAACHNLDPYLMSGPAIKGSFVRHAAGADMAVVEGNRGLYDGMDERGTYSTAALARELRAPVILVVDCTKTTSTAAAMVLGMKRFDPRVKIGGVVLNQISGERHKRVTTKAMEAIGVRVVGAIPRRAALALPERHMGLVATDEHAEVRAALDALGKMAEEHLDLDGIMEIAKSAPPMQRPRPAHKPALLADPPKIGVLRDSAFQFYYPDNIEALLAEGAEVIEVSALTMKRLPELDALYIGGGFPETHAVALARNRRFRESLSAEVERGLPVYAECGGLMYLGRSIEVKGKRHEMSGVLPLDFRMNPSPEAHGYVTARVTGRNPFYGTGALLKGHEFHYSSASLAGRSLPKRCSYALAIERGKGIMEGMDGICYRNVFAAYLHVHSLGTPEWATGMVGAAAGYKQKRQPVKTSSSR